MPKPTLDLTQPILSKNIFELAFDMVVDAVSTIGGKAMGVAEIALNTAQDAVGTIFGTVTSTGMGAVELARSNEEQKYGGNVLKLAQLSNMDKNGPNYADFTTIAAPITPNQAAKVSSQSQGMA